MVIQSGKGKCDCYSINQAQAWGLKRKVNKNLMPQLPEDIGTH